MGKYRIKISYETGDSFGRHDEEDLLDYEWDNLDMAKESLRRIKNHDEYIEDYDLFNKPTIKLPDGVVWDKKLRYIGLELITDDGKPYRCPTFWTGYFEKLYSAEIIYNDSDLIYNKRGY
jgi:hypothetical protein